MTPTTVQLHITPKFKNFFTNTKETNFTIEKFLEKLGLDKDIINELIYIKNMEQELKKGDYSVSAKLWRNIK